MAGNNNKSCLACVELKSLFLGRNMRSQVHMDTSATRPLSNVCKSFILGHTEQKYVTTLKHSSCTRRHTGVLSAFSFYRAGLH